MKPLSETGRYFPYLGGCLVVAGIVHIVSVLTMPRLAPKDAFSRIEALVPLNRMTLLPRPQPGKEVQPFNDPSVVLGVCRYNLAEAPLRVSAAITGDGLLSLSFQDRFGRVYYAMTDRAAVKGRIEALVLTAAQKATVEAADTEDGPAAELRLVTGQKQGFILFRVLAEQPGDYAIAQNMLADVTCVPEVLQP